ncbi:hypothetical protein ACSX1C_07205 [Pseudomonas sp. MBLB4123]|uniref:hypothetical protein n=1 Tax=Pseudomonas sp. MBLB4123 TaxID=3451557 RepID=UPI003F75376B
MVEFRKQYSADCYWAFSFAFSIVYAAVLSGLQVDAFVDRDNYLVYAEYSSDILERYVGEGALSVIFNEPVWLFINIFLSFFFFPDVVLRVIIFFSSFFTCIYILRFKVEYFFVLLVFLLLPQILKNNIIHLRQGLAITFFLMGWFSSRSGLRWTFMGLSSLIHASFLFLVLLFFLNQLFTIFRYSTGLRVLLISLLSVTIGGAGMWLARVLGARQGEGAQYFSVSGLGFIFWLAVAVLFFSQGRQFLRANAFAFSILLFYLITYFFLPVTARIFESGMILVLLAGLSLDSYRKVCFFSAVFFYFCVQWYQRAGLPGFGWGVENYL